MAFARAVNLRPDDVPDFVGKAKKADHEDGSRFRRCVKGAKETKPVYKASSKEFSAGEALHVQAVSSEVEVARSRAAARHELARVKRILTDPESRRCFARAVEALGSQTTVRRAGNVTVHTVVNNVRVTPLPLGSAVAGTDGGFGVSIAMRVTYRVSGAVRSVEVPTSLDIDALGFLLGRGQVTLATMTFGAPFSADVETQLFSRLISRAIRAGRQLPAIAR